MPHTVIREKPILFSAPMVRAIMDGRKTQTRRIVKPQPVNQLVYVDGHAPNGDQYLCEWVEEGAGYDALRKCPYGTIGDRLWVRESWMPLWDAGDGSYTCLPPTGCEYTPDIIKYRADGEKPKNFAASWRHARYMPRVASRLTLEITDIRVERLQDISNNDAIDEGCSGERWHEGDGNEGQVEPWEQFRDLWESINGPDSWTANPWVWAISFRRLENQ